MLKEFYQVNQVEGNSGLLIWPADWSLEITGLKEWVDGVSKLPMVDEENVCGWSLQAPCGVLTNVGEVSKLPMVY